MGSEVLDEYQTVQSWGQLETTLQELQGSSGRIAIDFETTDLRPRFAELVGIAICYRPDQATYISFGGDDKARESNRLALRKVLEVCNGRDFIAHNANYELSIISNLLPDVLLPLLHDTMILARLLGKESIGLKALCGDVGHKMEDFQSMLERCGVARIQDADPIEVTPYAAADALVTYKLFNLYHPQLDEDEWDIYTNMELPLLPITVDMQLEGVNLDEDVLNATLVDTQKVKKALHDEILVEVTTMLHEDTEPAPTKKDPDRTKPVYFSKKSNQRVGPPKSTSVKKANEWVFNPGSWQQITSLLGIESSDEDHLLDDGSDLAVKIRDYKKEVKFEGSYVQPCIRMLPRAYGSFNQVGTATGRYSASGWKEVGGAPWGINLQTPPKRIKQSLIADAGKRLVQLDYSAIEFRVLAHMSGDRNLVPAFREGRDPHAEMMKTANINDRRAAKVINFGLGYEPNDNSAAWVLKRLLRTQDIVIDDKEAKRLVAAYRDTWVDFRSYYEYIEDRIKKDGYVQTIHGRKLRLKWLKGNNRYYDKVNRKTLRDGVNMPIQGTAAEIIKLAMIDIRTNVLPRLDFDVQWKPWVHDSLMFQVDKGREEELVSVVKPAMENIITLDVPVLVEAEVGNSWGDMEEVK
jgi:DNA polymerase I